MFDKNWYIRNFDIVVQEILGYILLFLKQKEIALSKWGKVSKSTLWPKIFHSKLCTMITLCHYYTIRSLWNDIWQLEELIFIWGSEDWQFTRILTGNTQFLTRFFEKNEDLNTALIKTVLSRDSVVNMVHLELSSSKQ